MKNKSSCQEQVLNHIRRRELTKILPIKFSIKYPLFCLAFLLGALSISLSRNLDQDIQRQKKELQQLKNSLAAQRKSLKNTLKKKTGVVTKMDQLSENIGLIEKYLAQLDITSHTLKLSRQHKSLELEKLQKRIEKRNDLIARRVRSLYISGKSDYLMFYQIPSDHKSFLKRLFFVKRLVDYDKSIIDSARSDAQSKQQLIHSIQKKMEEISAFREHKNHEKRIFSQDRNKLKHNLAKLQSDENVKRRALKEMEENEKALLKIIKALEKQRKLELARNKKRLELDKKGEFCFPVPNGRLVSKYGMQYHATLKTSTKNLGVEYLGNVGDPVISAASGEVVYVDKIPGYGNGIIVYNGSGYYNIYGNLYGIKVKVGDKIFGCQEIAEIPSGTGNLKRKVYFEVRKERTPINPVNWLKTMID